MLQSMLSAYKRWVSPALPVACRFVPTCSEYAMEAVERHGALRGSMLTVWRILRCHPFCRRGHDPVPERFWRNHTAGRLSGERFASGHELGRAERHCELHGL